MHPGPAAGVLASDHPCRGPRGALRTKLRTQRQRASGGHHGHPAAARGIVRPRAPSAGRVSRCPQTCYDWLMFSIAVAILGLALLIVLHEGGHFLVARLCGM